MPVSHYLRDTWYILRAEAERERILILQCWIELYPAVIYTTEQLSLCNVIPVKLRDQSHLWTQQDPAAVSVKWSSLSSVGWYCKTAISSLVGSNGRIRILSHCNHVCLVQTNKTYWSSLLLFERLEFIPFWSDNDIFFKKFSKDALNWSIAWVVLSND